MKLVLLTLLAMIAFAANSVLNRMALAPGDMDAVSFGVVRLVSGAVALSALVAYQGRGFTLGGLSRLWAVVALLAYLFGFSLAYEVLDPGFGALILFGVVQVTMFAGAVLSREQMPLTRWTGAALAMAGLVWLLWPIGEVEPSWTHVASMTLAGLGWGVYSLFGRASGDPLQATAMNFLLAAPMGFVLLLGPQEVSLPTAGVTWAIVSGVLTSGLGYALWYQILPDLGASRAAVAQLSVPVIALAGGMMFLGEELTARFALAAVLVISGVVLSLRPR
ncbi:EamA domain-containing membrane protein RarD [Shimia gijangensis]|uniref:EamA domain-containing membrane protein RarD n=1 Tax=Shimia gijangensis TaxID=1470563 RepID=A0A1M6CTH8_9RHOB|nr:DMT family transporter [Shimia gijangensis]SHI64260.1 EamA domain-containing membrane protein RarD [Shimia gijangensis]